MPIPDRTLAPLVPLSATRFLQTDHASQLGTWTPHGGSPRWAGGRGSFEAAVASPAQGTNFTGLDEWLCWLWSRRLLLLLTDLCAHNSIPFGFIVS